MVRKVFSMHDSVVESYDPPFLAINRGDAIRGWIQAMKGTPDNKFVQSPGDYTLYEVGEFDTSNGMLTPYTSHQRIGSALEFLPKEQ